MFYLEVSIFIFYYLLGDLDLDLLPLPMPADFSWEISIFLPPSSVPSILSIAYSIDSLSANSTKLKRSKFLSPPKNKKQTNERVRSACKSTKFAVRLTLLHPWSCGRWCRWLLRLSWSNLSGPVEKQRKNAWDAILINSLPPSNQSFWAIKVPNAVMR